MSEGIPPADPEELLRRAVEAGRNIKFGRGVVGKTSYAVIALIGMWVVVVWRLGSDPVMNCFLLASGAIVTGAFIWWAAATQRFAERNPAQAMLEGGEMLEYQRWEAQTKGGRGANRGPRIAEEAPLSLPRRR